MVNYGFVIDNRTCIGCHACTVACKAEHDVPIGVNRTHVKYIETGTYPDTNREFSVHRCNHCEDAPCTTICPTTALFTREDGIVDFDDDRCIGCRSCMQACPYDALYIDPNKGTAAKCNYCAHRVENSYEPACVIVCPTESIISGDLDDPNSAISIRIEQHEVKVRKPEAGTKPNLYYVEASEEMLDPAATEIGPYIWTEQAAGVGHFAKYADKRLDAADTPSMLVQLALEKKAKKANPRDRAIIRDVMEKLAAKPKRTYDQPSKGILWDGEVAGYIVAKSAAAGFYLFLVYGLFNGVFSGEEFAFYTVFSLLLLGITGLLLVKDLDKPWRFVYVILRPNWKSWLVRGAYIISGFGAVLVGHIAIELFAIPLTHEMLAMAGAPLAWMTGAYTGWLFKQAKGREMWANRSDLSIALTATAEMAVFGGLPFLLMDIFDWNPPMANSWLLAMGMILLIVYWMGFIHIREGLREAQMEPLL